MNNAKNTIRWCDYTWNPITGCLRGCSYCYARKMAHRFKRDFTPRLHEDRLLEPSKLKKPSKIFVCSMSDLLGNGVPDEWVNEVMATMLGTHQHIYQLLTKHPERYGPWGTIPANWWTGATATDQASWDHACESLSRFPESAVRWISAEPMLGSIKPTGWIPDWVVVGALTGHGKRKQEDSAARGIGLSARLQVVDVPVFEKDSLGRDKPAREWPTETRRA